MTKGRQEAYVLSFLYVGIYWNNHHHLLHACATVNGAMLWELAMLQMDEEQPRDEPANSFRRRSVRATDAH